MGCHREILSASTWWTCEAGMVIRHSMCSLRHEVMPMSGGTLPLDPIKCPLVMVFACSAASVELDWGFAAWKAVELASNWVDGSIVAVDRSAFAKPEAVTSSRAVDIDFRCAADSVDSSATDSVRKQKMKKEEYGIRSRLMMMMMFVLYSPSDPTSSDSRRATATLHPCCCHSSAVNLSGSYCWESHRSRTTIDWLTSRFYWVRQRTCKNERYRQTLHYPAIHKTTRELSNSPSNLLERMKCFWWSGSARCRRRHDRIESQALLGREIISLWNGDEIKANAQRQRRKF